MNTTQLECFMAVANHLNFSRAAEQLRITQPAVSHQINTLEDELGVKLFHRTSKSVRLTQEGFQFIHYAGEIQKLWEVARNRMKESSLSLPKRLVVGCRSTAEMRMLRPGLEALRREAPELLPELRLIPFDSLENLLTDGDVHLMFAFRDSVPAKTRFRELLRCPVMCLCTPEHPLAQRETVTLEQLRRAGRIATCRPPICPPALFSLQSQAVGGRPTEEILFCDNQEAMLTLVETGYAFAVAADFPFARLPGLRYLPVEEFQPLSFGAVFLPRERNPGLHRLLTLLEEQFRQAGAPRDGA